MPASYATSPIVALAFAKMELSRFAGFGADSDEAQDVALYYPMALAECLAFADWSFASMRRALPQATLPIANAADPDLPWFFHLPAGLVEVRELTDATGGDVRWRRDAEGLRADAAGPLSIRFTGTPENEAAWPGAFQHAVAAHLAALMGPRYLGGVSTKLDRLEQQKLRQLQIAARQDARQASALRYDGEDEAGDWAAEARA